MKTYLYVGIGGAVGSMLRYLVSLITLHFFGNGFPFGTVAVNLLGAFLLGWFTTHILYQTNPPLAAAIGTGMIGSFTTLSTLSVDVLFLVENQDFVSVFLYVMISVFGGFLLALAGLNLGKKKVKSQ
ncbi:CrcB family protein [Robertmurraya massiliosenegalensis]|uniref:fluoride efflux transporter FluC n=1 Tax=Robertmurraya TaxID=2837507 RepID=UPI0039A4B2FA